MKINKILAAAAIAMPLQFAQAQEPAINAQVAAIDVVGYDTGLALMLGYEHPAEFIFKNVSMEGEVTASVVNPSYDFFNLSEELSFYTAGVYLKYTHPFTEQFSVYGRAGVHYASITYTTNTIGLSDTDNNVGRNFGLGVNFDVAQNVSLTAGATRFVTDTNLSGDLNLISVGAKFKL